MNVLLHICCGPCLAAFNSYFKAEGIEYSGFFYNPNIHPYAEFARRMATLKEYAGELGLEVIYDPQFDQMAWEKNFKNTPAEKRCAYCYARRLDRTAREAASRNFTHFTTTLLISPYQDHDFIVKTAEEAAKRHGVEFYYHDFRTMFREGQAMAREAGIYRQKYCGCIYSYRESKFRDKISWD